MTPTHMAAMTRRPWARLRMAVASAGLRGLADQRVRGDPGAGEGDVGGPGAGLAHLVIPGRHLHTPSVRAGTMNTPMPLPGGACGSVRAKTMNASASGALVMKRLSPSMTHPPSVAARW